MGTIPFSNSCTVDLVSHPLLSTGSSAMQLCTMPTQVDRKGKGNNEWLETRIGQRSMNIFHQHLVPVCITTATAWQMVSSDICDYLAWSVSVLDTVNSHSGVEQSHNEVDVGTSRSEVPASHIWASLSLHLSKEILG